VRATACRLTGLNLKQERTGGYHDAFRARRLQHLVRRQGAGISKSRQIFRARKSLISRCRGTVETLRVAVCT
jgi:hypothetical protein